MGDQTNGTKIDEQIDEQTEEMIDDLIDESDDDNEESEINEEEIEQTDEPEFIDLKGYVNSYEIQRKYPHVIRWKKNNKIVREWIDKESGYIHVSLNRKPKLKHQLIGMQFLPNPDNLKYIDHINHIRTDNRICNLRWVTHQDNNRNKSKCNGVEYIYVDTIPDDSIVVDEYSNWKFENYYYYDNKFYFYNGIQYRILHINEDKRGNKHVMVRDTNNKSRAIYYSKFKKQRGLID